MIERSIQFELFKKYSSGIDVMKNWFIFCKGRSIYVGDTEKKFKENPFGGQKLVIFDSLNQLTLMGQRLSKNFKIFKKKITQKILVLKNVQVYKKDFFKNIQIF